MEIACTRAELIARTSLYQPYFLNRIASEHEEAVSNAQALLWGLGDDVYLRARAEAWMNGQGPGYRDFSHWASPRKISAGMDRAVRHMLSPLPPPCPRPSGPSVTFLYHEARRYRVPVTRIVDHAAPGASVLRPFPKAFGMQVLVHTNDHPPPHIHIQMPPGGSETRYQWPALAPMKGDQPLSGAGEKSLKRYIASYKEEVADKLRRVYGQMAQ